MKGFLDKELQMKSRKMALGFDCLLAFTNRALIFMEKDAWKHRRALLSKIFSYDFVNSQIPNMIHSVNLIF